MGEGSPFNLKPSILKYGRDKITTGNFSRARFVGGPVKIPWGAQPASHQAWQAHLQKLASLGQEGVPFRPNRRFQVGLAEALAVLLEVSRKGPVGGEVWSWL